MKNRRRIIIALVLVAVFAVGAVLYLTVLGPALEPEETVKVPIETAGRGDRHDGPHTDIPPHHGGERAVDIGKERIRQF